MNDAVKGLQLLVDSFAAAPDAQERDDLLQDIIAHDTPQAQGFLRLVADNTDEDRYLRCDATCAICVRSGGAERLQNVLLYLSNPYDAYEYTSACAVVAAIHFAPAVEILMAQFDAPLEEACLDALVDAVEAVDAALALRVFSAWLDAARTTPEVDETRAVLALGVLQRLRIPAAEATLLAFADAVAEKQPSLAAAARDAAQSLRRPEVVEDEDMPEESDAFAGEDD